MARTAERKGRRKGTQNKGYFYRKGRGWCASEGNRAIPLRREDGSKIVEKAASREARDAFSRYTIAKRQQPAATTNADQITVIELCQLYLDTVEAAGSINTLKIRADALFDLCTGLPAGCRAKREATKSMKFSEQELRQKRIHAGHGKKRAIDLLPLHIDQWLNCHPKWDGCKRTKVQAIKRVLSYGVAAGLLSRNPLKGYKTSRPKVRPTYLTPEQEAACYEHANAQLAMAIKVCIRTGARYGCEFCQLTAKHISMVDNEKMEWHFSAKVAKNRKPRVIMISDPTIIAIVKHQMTLFPAGLLFRNTAGLPWTPESLKQAFATLKTRLAKKGVNLDDKASMYTCRHTYAKRTLNGYWSGKMTNIETLSKLMGITREVCWHHYAEWNETYTSPLWEASVSRPAPGPDRGAM